MRMCLTMLAMKWRCYFPNSERINSGNPQSLTPSTWLETVRCALSDHSFFLSSYDFICVVTVKKPPKLKSRWDPFEILEHDVKSRIRSRRPLVGTPHQPTQSVSGGAASGEKRRRESIGCPMPGCTEMFESPLGLATHLVVAHPEDGKTATDFGVGIIMQYGEADDAVTRLGKALPMAGVESMKVLGQSQQRLKFTSLQDGGAAQKRVVRVLDAFIRGLAGARPGVVGHMPPIITDRKSLVSTHGAAGSAAMVQAFEAQNQDGIAHTGMCSVSRSL